MNTYTVELGSEDGFYIVFLFENIGGSKHTRGYCLSLNECEARYEAEILCEKYGAVLVDGI